LAGKLPATGEKSASIVLLFLAAVRDWFLASANEPTNAWEDFPTIMLGRRHICRQLSKTSHYAANKCAPASGRSFQHSFLRQFK
jgi:hypothetical protein